VNYLVFVLSHDGVPNRQLTTKQHTARELSHRQQ